MAVWSWIFLFLFLILHTVNLLLLSAENDWSWRETWHFSYGDFSPAAAAAAAAAGCNGGRRSSTEEWWWRGRNNSVRNRTWWARDWGADSPRQLRPGLPGSLPLRLPKEEELPVPQEAQIQEHHVQDAPAIKTPNEWKPPIFDWSFHIVWLEPWFWRITRSKTSSSWMRMASLWLDMGFLGTRSRLSIFLKRKLSPPWRTS